MSEVIFEVREDATDGGFTASAPSFGIHTEANDLRELRANVREAVDCYFDETMDAPKIIRLHFIARMNWDYGVTVLKTANAEAGKGEKS